MLRMGFQEMKEDENLQPIDGIMQLPLPVNLGVAIGSKVCADRGDNNFFFFFFFK